MIIQLYTLGRVVQLGYSRNQYSDYLKPLPHAHFVNAPNAASLRAIGLTLNLLTLPHDTTIIATKT